MRASVWRLGLTAEDGLMYGRSIQASVPRNGFAEMKKSHSVHSD